MRTYIFSALFNTIIFKKHTPELQLGLYQDEKDTNNPVELLASGSLYSLRNRRKRRHADDHAAILKKVKLTFEE